MCHGCDLENGHHCVWHMRYIENSELETIPNWCPLRDLPRKKMLFGLDGASNAMEIRERGRQEGYNDCIDEILKGVNESDERTV